MKSLSGLPGWPAALTEAEALAYTRVSAAQMKKWRDDGTVKFLMRGRNGAAIALRANLDDALAGLFGYNGGSDTRTWFDDGPIEF